MNRKALGRGIGALIASGEDEKGVSEIDIDLIDANPDQPRTQFTEQNLDELAQSIRVNGIVQPIIVRRKASRYEIVAGERRWRASQRAGLLRIPAIVKDIADDKLLEIALVENIQRQELSAIEEARAYKKLIETVGLTQESVAERVGKNRTVVTTFLRLLRLPEDVQKMIEESKISAGHGRALLMIDSISEQKRIAKQISENSLSVREAEKLVKKSGKPIKSNVKTPVVIDANMKAAEVKMRRALATNVKILPSSDGTGGKIEIEYYGSTDLDRIYRLLLGE